ncbi:hypothetical protein Emed_000562 [Eimeria media]
MKLHRKIKRVSVYVQQNKGFLSVQQQRQLTGCKHVSMLPACTTTVEAPSTVGASALTSGVKGFTSGPPSSGGVSPASCFLTLRPSPVLQRLAEKFDDQAAAVDAEPPQAEARVYVREAEDANAPVVSASSSSIESGVDAGRVKGASSTQRAAGEEAVSHADEATYEEVRLQELEFDALEQLFVYPCPCGDLFELPLADLRAAAAAETQGFALASCPSCSLKIKVAGMEGGQVASVVEAKMPLYVRLKRRRDEPPPPFLCVLQPQKRQQLAGGRAGCGGLLERALIFRHLDAAPPPEPLEADQSNTSQSQSEGGQVPQPQTCVVDVVTEGGGEAGGTSERAANSGVSTDNQHVADAEDSSFAEECTKTFWSAFNTPLRKDVFGSGVATEATPSSSAVGYLDAVEEAVRSLRRFRVEQRKTLSDEAAAEGRNMILHDGRVVHVLDVAQDAGKRAEIASFDEQQEAGEFEYDLYAIECDSEDACSVLPPFAAREAHKQRLLELLQQDRSAVALVEVEDVDQDTGLVTRGCGGMQLFLEEFGDIDDSDSDEGGEIDYPSGESSHDERETRRSARRQWDGESSEATSSESCLSDKDDFFDDDDL